MTLASNDPSPSSTEQSASDVPPAPKPRSLLRVVSQWLLDLLLQMLRNAVWAIFGALVLVLVGLASVPERQAPILDGIHEHPIQAVAAVVGVLVMIAAAEYFKHLELPGMSGHGMPGASYRAWPYRVLRGLLLTVLVGGTALSVLTAVTLIVLLATRPAGCPTWVCAPPAEVAILRPNSAHDGTLEVYATSIETAAYVLHGDPALYTDQTLPGANEAASAQGLAPWPVSAVLLSSTAGASAAQSPATPSTGACMSTAAPYRVVVGIHSLQRGSFGIVIQAVTLRVLDVPPSPYPLNVWVKGTFLTHQSNPFCAVYAGEGSGDQIPAIYQPAPLGHVQLVPGEADNLDIQLSSRVPVDVRFQIFVTYRVANATEQHTLQVPGTFEVVFADPSSWHPYDFEGHLQPSA